MLARAGSAVSAKGWAAAAVAVGLVSLALWQAGQIRGGVTGPESATLGRGTTLYPGASGIRLPTLEGPVVGEERTLSLADQRGHVLVINVWGSWCGPCRAEAPDLAAVSRQTQSRGVRFIGIDVRDEPAAAVGFAREYGITYPSLDDPEGRLLARFDGIIPVKAIPSTLVVDASGVIRARVIGRVDRSALSSLIADTEKIG